MRGYCVDCKHGRFHETADAVVCSLLPDGIMVELSPGTYGLCVMGRDGNKLFITSTTPEVGYAFEPRQQGKLKPVSVDLSKWRI